MSDQRQLPARQLDWPELVRRVRARTPARLLMGRVGASYDTATQLQLREAHAAARDAVHAEFSLVQLGPEVISAHGVFLVSTAVGSKAEYLTRPERGRRLSLSATDELRAKCPAGCDLQLVIGDGLSVTAVLAQAPPLLPLLVAGAQRRGWTIGQTFAVRYCRVGVLNDIGDLLRPQIVVLLIGERPGMATAESLSAYMAYRPQRGHTDVDRNLISNIHARGTPVSSAAERILELAGRMRQARAGGVALVDWKACKPALND